MNEIWKPVVGYEGLYEVSNLGNVRSLNWRNTGEVRNLYLKKQRYGYRQVELYFKNKPKMVTVHRLVATAFIPNPNNLPQINHKDLDKTNNNVENLEWVTASENAKHYQRHVAEKGIVPNKGCNNINRIYGTRKSKYGHTNNPITQLTLGGEVVCEWDTCLQIKRSLGYKQSSVFECCEGKRRTAYGYIWRFAS